jgi:fumarate hydratase class II
MSELDEVKKEVAETQASVAKLANFVGLLTPEDDTSILDECTDIIKRYTPQPKPLSAWQTFRQTQQTLHAAAYVEAQRVAWNARGEADKKVVVNPEWPDRAIVVDCVQARIDELKEP